MLKDILDFHGCIISSLCAVILFSIIILIKINEIKSNRLYFKAILTYWCIVTTIIGVGFIIHIVIFNILQYGLYNIKIKYITMIITAMMLASFPGMVITVMTIKEKGYLSNFSKIFTIEVILLIIPDMVTNITSNAIKEPNFIFYSICNDFLGSFLLGIILSLIITKLNMINFKMEEIDKINVRYYSITATVLTIVLSLIIYLFFINQFPSKVVIRLTDWKGISINYTNEKGMSAYDIIKPDTKSDLSKYQGYEISFIAISEPTGSMQVVSGNYDLNSNGIVIISSARANICRNKKNEFIIDATSRTVILQGQIIPMTMWSSLSSNFRIAIISGIFIIISSIIASITAIFVKIKKDT